MTKLEQLDEQNFSIIDLILLLWSRKLLISLITIFFSICSIFYALNQDNIYKSEALLAIAGESNTQGIASEYSGIASMAGIKLPSSGSENKSDLAMAMLDSRDFLRILIEKNPNFLPLIFAVDSYELSTNTIKYDNSIFNAKDNTWTREASYPLSSKPSYIEAHSKFKKIFQINKSKDTGYISISLEHHSPVIAKTFLDEIIFQLNQSSRKKKLIETSESLEYLKEKAIVTKTAPISSAINNLIEAQLKTQMMAQITDDYLLQVIDAPYVPEVRSKPNRAIICVMGSIIGFMLSALWVFSSFFIFSGLKNHNS